MIYFKKVFFFSLNSQNAETLTIFKFNKGWLPGSWGLQAGSVFPQRGPWTSAWPPPAWVCVLPSPVFRGPDFSTKRPGDLQDGNRTAHSSYSTFNLFNLGVHFLGELVFLTFSWFVVPAELQTDGGEEVSDEFLDLLVEVRVGQERGQHSQVAAEVAPHCVVWFIDKGLHQLQNLHGADHPCTRLGEKTSVVTRLHPWCEARLLRMSFDHCWEPFVGSFTLSFLVFILIPLYSLTFAAAAHFLSLRAAHNQSFLISLT